MMYKNMSVTSKRIALIAIVAGVTICVPSLPTGNHTSNLEESDSPNGTTKSEAADAHPSLPNVINGDENSSTSTDLQSTSSSPNYGGDESTEAGTTANFVKSSTTAPEGRSLDGEDVDQMSTTWSTGPSETPSRDVTTVAVEPTSTETQTGSNTLNSTLALPQEGEGLNNDKELAKGQDSANDSAQVNGQDNHTPPVKKEEELEGDGQDGGKDPNQHQKKKAQKDNQIGTEPPKENKQHVHLDCSGDEPLKDNGQHTDKDTEQQEKGRKKDNRTEHTKKRGPDINRSANKQENHGQTFPHKEEVTAASKNESLSTSVAPSAWVAGNISLEEKRVIDFAAVYLWLAPLSLMRRAMYASLRFISSFFPILNRLAEPVLEFLDAANVGYFIGRLPEMILGGKKAIKQVVKDYARDVALTHP